MRSPRRLLTTVAVAAAASALLGASPAAAATPDRLTVSSTGLSADAVFSNAPADGRLVTGQVYTDVFVYAADHAVTPDGVTHPEDFAWVDVYSYKADRRGVIGTVSSSAGHASGAQAEFTADGSRLASATLTAQVPLESCTQRACRSAGIADVSVRWSATGATTTVKGSYRTSDPGQFSSTGRFTGSSREASATGAVPVLGTATSVHASISSGTWTERTISHG